MELFNSIRSTPLHYKLVDKSKDSTVERSTLVSLLIYHHVDSQYPEYFRYVSRSL